MSAFLLPRFTTRRVTRFLALLAFCMLARPIFAAETDPLESLRKEIAQAIARGDASAINHVLARHEVRAPAQFVVEVTEDGQLIWPTRPKSVTAQEWATLKRSELLYEYPENRRLWMSLMDLDEDGQRDLVINAYMGGTGLFSCVTVGRRAGARFVAAKRADDNCLYTINGRGSDQEAHWVKLGGRVYLAYREGEYGADRLALSRAFETAERAPDTLVIEYRYRHQVLERALNGSGEPQAPIAPALRAALQAALDQIGDTPAQDSGGSYAQCPLPEGMAEEDSNWPWFGAGHYTFEIVADVPVHLDGQCHAARLITYRNSYQIDRERVPTALSYMRTPDDTAQDIEVRTRRTALRVRREAAPDPAAN